MAARIGEPVDGPWTGGQVRLSAGVALADVEREIRQVVDTELARLPVFRTELIRESIPSAERAAGVALPHLWRRRFAPPPPPSVDSPVFSVSCEKVRRLHRHLSVISTWRGERTMAHKQVFFRSEARERILRGVSALADAVRVTLGPKSKCVLIEKRFGAPVVCNDGVTIAKEMELRTTWRTWASR